MRKEEVIMFARPTIVQVRPDTIDETTKIFDEGVVPGAKSQKGYKGIYLLIDRKTGKGISVSLWDSEADSTANEQSGYYKEQVDRFKNFMTAPPVQEGYEVAVQG